jgi:hypothetical protein
MILGYDSRKEGINMKTYFLVKQFDGQKINIFLTDNSTWKKENVLMTLEAENFEDAQKKISFEKRIQGESKFL